jgi:enterochelin esterase family protein
MMGPGIWNHANEFGNPVIEDDAATFVWFGKKAPLIRGDFTDWEWGKPAKFKRVEPGRWLFRHTFPMDAYIEYAFWDGDQRVPDPLNNRKTPNGVGEVNHYFYMPQAGPNPLAQRSKQHKRIQGTLSNHIIESSLLANGKRRIYLYQPETKSPCPLLVVWDGYDYLRRARLDIIIDNLIAQKRITPIALAMIPNGGKARMVEYACSEASPALIEAEILPLCQKQLNLIDIRQNPSAYGILGASMGGLMALYSALRLPHIFGSVISQSGAFSMFERNMVVWDLLENAHSLPQTISMSVGQFDFVSLLIANREMAHLVRQLSIDFYYREYPAGHNFPAWRDDINHHLEHIFPFKG